MASAKNNARINKANIRELPFYNLNSLDFHNLFTNDSSYSPPTRRYLDRLLTSIHNLDLFSLNTRDKNSEFEFDLNPNVVRSNYYSPHSFNNMKNNLNNNALPNKASNFSILHNNIRSMRRNLENFQTHLLDELNYHFNIIGITETRINKPEVVDFIPSLPNYHFEFVPTPLAAGGVGMYIDNKLNYTIIEKFSNESFQALWIEIQMQRDANIICGVIYRQHNSPERFQTYMEETMEN